VVIHNTGNTRLRAVKITTTLTTQPASTPTAPTSYSCVVDGSGDPVTVTTATGADLDSGSNWTCTAVYTWDTVEAIEAGDLTIDSTVGATAYTPSITLSDTVLVPSHPHFELTLDEAICTSAAPAPENFAGECAFCSSNI
jgi:hypothetical protein